MLLILLILSLLAHFAKVQIQPLDLEYPIVEAKLFKMQVIGFQFANEIYMHIYVQWQL